MMISLGSGGWISTALRGSALIALSGMLAAGCASTGTTSGGGTNTSRGGGDAPQREPDPQAGPTVEEDALVKVKDNMFPPVDVGAWVCEPKSWGEGRTAHLHCTAPAGTKGLLATLRTMPEVISAEPAK